MFLLPQAVLSLFPVRAAEQEQFRQELPREPVVQKYRTEPEPA